MENIINFEEKKMEMAVRENADYLLWYIFNSPDAETARQANIYRRKKWGKRNRSR